jgi:D-lactate dehydrogenase (cytochrome)
LTQLSTLFGARLSTAAAIREQHGKGESFHPVAPPDAVVFVRSTAEVSAAVKACAAHRVPIVAFGAGTSLEGHVAALKGGVSIDLSQMDAILAVNPEDMDVTVQAGVRREKLNAYLRDTGLFFPVDPGADATLGGMAATRASGTNSVRYGTMRENVLALEVVLADGEVIRTASRARKSAAGYDLTRLFVGSEGTLGIITEVTLRLYGIPEAVSAAVCSFPSVAAATNAVITAMQTGLSLARIEFLDEMVMQAVVRHAQLDYPVAPTLFFELNGSPSSVGEQAEMLKAIVAEHNSDDFRWTSSPEERSALWAARHKAYYAIASSQPGCQVWSADTCVPVSRLAEAILAARADLDASPLTAGIVGHVGDGNFHVAILFDPNDAVQVAEAKRLNGIIVRRAIAMGGTCTGEHGIGYGKVDYLAAEMGDAINVMRRIKAALDPEGLLNPGKVLTGVQS